MNVSELLDRILDSVDASAYLTPAAQVDPAQRHAMSEIASALHDPEQGPEFARAIAQKHHRNKRIDEVMFLSSLHVIAASPAVADYALAARLAGEQEFAAMKLGGPNLSDNLASVDRHRGVLAYLMGNYDVALDYFTRTLERQRTAENLGNILCTLIRLGEVDDAAALLVRIRTRFPDTLVHAVNDMVIRDPDLALIRNLED